MPEQVEPTPEDQPIVLHMERRSAGQWLRDRLHRRSADQAEQTEALGYFARLKADLERRFPPAGRHAALPPVPVPPSRLSTKPSRTSLITDPEGAQAPWEPIPADEVPPAPPEDVFLPALPVPEDQYAWMSVPGAAREQEEPEVPEEPKDPTIVMQVIRPSIEDKLRSYLRSLPRYGRG